MTDDQLDFPAVSPSELLISRLMSERQSSLTIPMNDHLWDITLSSDVSHQKPSMTLQLEINHQPCTCFTGRALIDQIMDKAFPTQALLALPEDLQQAVLNSNLQGLTEQLTQATGTTVTFVSLSPSDALPFHADLTLNVAIDGTNYPVYLESNPIVFDLLKLLPVQHTETASDIPLWGSLEVGRAALPRNDVEQLATGDIVFLSYHVTGQQLILRMHSGLAFLGEADGTQVTIRNRMDTMQDDQQTDQEINLSDMEVELLFEVGRQQFSVQEVQALQAGHVFELDRPIEQPVNIRVNGKLIAECQLVQVNNRLGARITRIVN